MGRYWGTKILFIEAILGLCRIGVIRGPLASALAIAFVAESVSRSYCQMEALEFVD
jgi:hypothetical protein